MTIFYIHTTHHTSLETITQTLFWLKRFLICMTCIVMLYVHALFRICTKFNDIQEKQKFLFFHKNKKFCCRYDVIFRTQWPIFGICDVISHRCDTIKSVSSWYEFVSRHSTTLPSFIISQKRPDRVNDQFIAMLTGEEKFNWAQIRLCVMGKNEINSR